MKEAHIVKVVRYVISTLTPAVPGKGLAVFATNLTTRAILDALQADYQTPLPVTLRGDRGHRRTGPPSGRRPSDTCSK